MKNENDLEKPYYQRMAEQEQYEEGRKMCKRFVIIVSIIIVAFGVPIMCTSCESSTINEEPAKDKSLYWETRHDAIPKPMQGEWVSVSDKTEIVLIVTDRFVMTEHFRIDREQDNSVRVNDSILNMYQNGKFYALAFGSNGALTITADNDCYDIVVPFQQQQTNLN